LNAAITPCDAGVSVTLGFVSVRRAVAGVVVGCCTSVLFCGPAALFCELAGLLVVAGAAVRGRAGGEEFEFWARAMGHAVANIMAVLVSNLLIMFCSS